MLNWYTADLHLHTVLSPCADLSMGPRDIVKKAIEQKLDMIAVTDHNSAENVKAVVNAAAGTGLTVVPGMEVYVREGAHMICLFPDADTDMEFQQFVYQHLQDGKSDPDIFGQQIVVDEQENIIGENDRLLAFPLKASLEMVAKRTAELQGIIFPAHIDRKSFSLLRVLGFIPDNLNIDAVEISGEYDDAAKTIRWLKNSRYAVLRNSDSHHIDLVGSKKTHLKLAAPNFTELKLAIQARAGRCAAVQVLDHATDTSI